MKASLLLFGFIGCGYAALSQQILTGTLVQAKRVSYVQNSAGFDIQSGLYRNREAATERQMLPMISPNNYMSQIGFFCKKEIQLQDITHIPIKFRLGSVDYTDYLEGKRNSPGWIP